MIDYTLNNTTCFNNLKSYFLVLNNDFTIDNNYLIFKNKRLNLQNFDIREALYANNGLLLNNLNEGSITTSNFFEILKIYEFKNIYLEHENDFYNNFGSEEDFIDKYNNYFFQLLLYHDYLSPELERLLRTFVNRIYLIENNIGYTDNPKFVKEVDFYNTSLQQIDDINSKVQTGKNKSMKLIKTNPNSDGSYSDDNTLEEYPDHSIEWYRPLSKTGYLNIFLNILLFLSIGIILGSILFVKAIS